MVPLLPLDSFHKTFSPERQGSLREPRLSDRNGKHANTSAETSRFCGEVTAVERPHLALGDIVPMDQGQNNND